MYRVEKKFSFPMGHRLCKHNGACFNFHGHNYNVLVGMSSATLNKDDMVIDFGKLKEFLKPYFDDFDHALMINKFDEYRESMEKLKMKMIVIDTDPTAERMSEQIFYYIDNNIDVLRGSSGNNRLYVEYVTVYETDGAKATYSRG